MRVSCVGLKPVYLLKVGAAGKYNLDALSSQDSCDQEHIRNHFPSYVADGN